MAPPPAIGTFEQAQEELLEKIKVSPDLKPIAAKKLLQLVKELDSSPSEDESGADLSAEARIKQGFVTFKNQFYSKNPELFAKLSQGQSPKFMIIACSDSRVCPTTILNLKPGEAFVVRNVANMVPASGEPGYPSTSAALEYAVLHLKVENILVIGHSRCGGIKALLTADHKNRWSDYIQDWIKVSDKLLSSSNAPDEADINSKCDHCEKESVNVGLTNLLTFPWIKSAVLGGTLALHGGHYSFVDGSFTHWTLDLKIGDEAKL